MIVNGQNLCLKSDLCDSKVTYLLCNSCNSGLEKVWTPVIVKFLTFFWRKVLLSFFLLKYSLQTNLIIKCQKNVLYYIINKSLF